MANFPFDDRDGWIWLDGSLVPWRDARLHVLSHGLHYASAVFEGERAYSGNIFRLRDHSDRLIASGRWLNFEIPFTAEQIDAASAEVLAANGLTDGYVRPIAWRGSEQLAVSATGTSIHLAIGAWPWPSYFGAERMQGIRVGGQAEWRRLPPETAPVHAKAAGCT
jgi:branched-chain amino acid aminotransferase